MTQVAAESRVDEAVRGLGRVERDANSVCQGWAHVDDGALLTVDRAQLGVGTETAASLVDAVELRRKNPTRGLEQLWTGDSDDGSRAERPKRAGGDHDPPETATVA